MLSRFLGVGAVKIDTKNIKKSVEEDDSHFGIFGNHKVGGQIRPYEPDYKDVLGKDVCRIIDNTISEAGLDMLL